MLRTFPQIYTIAQGRGCTHPRRQVAVATKLCTVAPNICGSSVWNLLQITLLTPESSVVSSTFLDKFVHPGVNYVARILHYSKHSITFVKDISKVHPKTGHKGPEE